MRIANVKDAEHYGAELTLQPLNTPEFCRLPKPKSRCALTGLSRTSLVELIEAGKVRAVRLRKEGAVRGIVLINRRSLLDYLHGLEVGGNKM